MDAALVREVCEIRTGESCRMRPLWRQKDKQAVREEEGKRGWQLRAGVRVTNGVRGQ